MKKNMYPDINSVVNLLMPIKSFCLKGILSGTTVWTVTLPLFQPVSNISPKN